MSPHFLLKNGSRSQDLGTGYTYSHWGVVAFKLSQRTELGDILM